MFHEMKAPAAIMFHVVNSGEFTFHEVIHSWEFCSEEWKTQEIPGNTQQGYETVLQMGQIGEKIVNKNLTLLSL
jgi:hypothetical protein